MTVKWTDKQKNVIDTRGRNILVSAAAGSGKTAVLVERIIRKILDKDNPVDVDKLLVVTFTKAAAAEMRERVLEALENALEKEPDNEHLQKQQTYIHNARITTIDSFCAGVVKEHFDKIELDPGTRIVDEAQMKMLETDILDTMLEEYFEGGSKEFLNLADQYTEPKKMGILAEIIALLYHSAMAHVNPKRWLSECLYAYEIKDVEEAEHTVWMSRLKTIVDEEIAAMLAKAKQAISLCYLADGPLKYAEDIENIKGMLERIDTGLSYDEIRAAVNNVKFDRLPAIKRDACDEELKEQVKELRNAIKKKTALLKKDLLSQSAKEMTADIVCSSEQVKTLINLTIDFADRFAAEKKEKCIMDFLDQEHYAMSILVDIDEEGNIFPSMAARDIASQYEEIMIDEYQDSNYIQEAILTSVSGGFGNNNVFMVGDVKQSIYKFRLANPNIFIDKYNRYSEDLSKQYCKIILDKNFRSRREIIDSVNYIFARMMHRELGGIEYEEGNRLSFGAQYYPDLPQKQDNRTELLLVDGAGNLNEAWAVAQRIKELVNPQNDFKITGKDGSFRTPCYNDIVILLRSIKGRADEYVKVLSEEGIPAYCESKVGYYDAKEVRTMIDYLSVIDNPLQDIPLASIMRSEIYKFTSEELAIIKAENDGNYYYDCAKLYLKNGKICKIKEKLEKLFADIDRYRKIVPYTSVYDLLTLIIDETGYGHYINALPNGIRRSKNIDILKEKALSYDAGTYKGLFNFVRYLEKIKDLGMEEGEASPVNENDNIVRIMTFHKSKGLQFPIVFVSGLGTKFNNSDVTGSLAIHESLGIGTDYMSDALRLKNPTIIKKIIHRVIKEENYAEYIRFLYVALTRAQEKMIMTASDSNMTKKIENWISYRACSNKELSYGDLIECSCMLDWIGKALVGNKGFDMVAERLGISPQVLHPSYREKSQIIAKWIQEDEITISYVSQMIDTSLSKQTLCEWDTQVVYDEDLKKKLEERLSWEYSYKGNFTIPAKLSVTEIKKMSMLYSDDEDISYYNDQSYYNSEIFTKTHKYENVVPEIVPEFIKQIRGDSNILTGAKKGTAYHRVFELFDFEMEPTRYNLEKMLINLVKCGKISKEMVDSINIVDIVAFTNTSLYRRMKKAYQNKQLYRERSFMMGVYAKNLPALAAGDSKEIILVQGIIDACFLEDGKFIIVDYKTDNIESMQQLVDIYAAQLESYKEAIEHLDNIIVSEKIIYSVKFGQEINC